MRYKRDMEQSMGLDAAAIAGGQPGVPQRVVGLDAGVSAIFC
jgi:hypothetical protein